METKNYYGIDVSAKELFLSNQEKSFGKFENNEKGHKKIVAVLKSNQGANYICMEATGFYNLDIATALSKTKDTFVMVANPRSVKHYAQAMMKRSKTDLVDAKLLAVYAEKIPLEAWRAPSENYFNLRAISRRIRALKDDSTAEKNRLHSYKATKATPDVIIKNTIAHIGQIKQSIKELEKEAIKIIKIDPELNRKFELLKTINGIAKLSAIYILSDIAFLTDDIDPKQLVAYEGLDPCKYESGTSVKKLEKISKKGNAQLRKSLFLPALVAIRVNKDVKSFFAKLVSAGKKKMQAVTAVMRKLLHAIYGMFKLDQKFDSSKCFVVVKKTSASA